MRALSDMQKHSARRAAMLLTMLAVAFTAWAQTASTADGWIIEKDVYGTKCRLKDFYGNRDNVTVYPAIIDGAAVVTIYERVEPKDFPKLETVYMYDHYEFNEMSPVPAGVKHIHVVNSSGTVVAEDAIPDGITKIPDICFYGCAEMEKLTLPKGLKVIGNHAFYGCKALKDIIIPDGVTDIGDYAFSYCDALKDISIPNSVTDIGDYAFDECKALTSITILDGVTDIGKYAFALCEALTSITIPNSVTSIGERAFTFCI